MSPSQRPPFKLQFM